MSGGGVSEVRDRSGGQTVVLVTGPSGAGRGTALRALEDMGYEPIDNLPLTLIPRLLEGPPIQRPLVLGIDVRNRDFSATGLVALIEALTARPDIAPQVLFLDCRPEELVRRFGETRRRHPLSPAEAPSEGVDSEIALLRSIRARADVLIDTSDLSPHDLKAELARWFDIDTSVGLSVSVQSFSYKRGLPRGLDLMFACRFLRNPHWEETLRDRDGRAPEVAAYVAADPRFPEFFERVRDLLLFLLPAQVAEGKSHVAIGFGCTGGQHRSIAVAEKMAKELAEAGWQVSKRHRELERRGSGGAAAAKGEKA